MREQHFNWTRAVVMLLLVVLTPTGVWAENISSAEALKKAQAFVQARGKSGVIVHMSEMPQSRRAQGNGAAVNDYYVFNIGNGDGFVIVSGDDRMTDILGYADRGSIDDETMPDALRYLLDGYAEQKEWLDEQDPEGNTTALRTQQRAAAVRTAIAPLVVTRWNQGAPYNNYCPKKGGENGESTVTGCVATSMAQIMYYYRFPESISTVIPGYTTKTLKIEVAELPAMTFAWDDMTSTYTSSDTGAAADAVAKLMQYCGAALQMNYNVAATGGSSAYNASMADVLKTYFGYDGSTSYAQRQHYSYQQWVELIYDELAADRPVVLGGQCSDGGHSFVCDGYDTGDYFHINWGWGGNSDGYFRLSALNPYDQGSGGSSSLDGFSFTQDAIFGIRPYNGVTAGCRLSLEKLQFDATGITATQTVNREAAEDAFTNIQIYAKVYSYWLGTCTYDYAAQLTSTDGTVLKTLYQVNNKSMTFGGNATDTKTDLSTPEGLANGTYYIKVVSRQTGTDEWLECYDGQQQQLTATVSGNTLTITAPFVSGTATLPTLIGLAVDGDKIKGHEQNVRATLKGSDNADYHGNIVLRVNGKDVVGKSVDIPAKATVDVHFVYTPDTAGDNKLTLYTDKKSGSQIGTETTVTITDSDASDTQDLTVETTFHNLSGSKFYGNAVKVTAHVTNPSTTNSYASKFNCSLREYDSAEAPVDGYQNATVISKYITIEKNGSTDVEFEYSGLKLGKFYCLRFTYTQGYQEGGENKKRTAEALITNRYEMGEGYLAYEADGSKSIMEKASTINAGSAVCVDLTGMASFNDVTISKSSNPNCLYLLADGAVTPSGLETANVVKGGSASTIALSDGYDFYTPVAFTAGNISYTRTFTVAAAGTEGWNTIMLPFTVSNITCENMGVVDWFHSADDTGKNFWVRAFVSDDAKVVNFDYATEMTANTPYIIAVPGNEWGTQWQMTGKPVTFSGSNATIVATTTEGLGGNNFQFCGATKSQSLEDVYALNDAGSAFVKNSTYNAPAFRAWFSATSISSLSRAALGIGSPETSGISDAMRLNDKDQMMNDKEAGTWYTLSGVRLTGRPAQKGIYIYQGKKVIIP